MYKKNKMLSAIAAVAVLSSGAMSFDMMATDEDKNAAIGTMSIITDVEKIEKSKPIFASYIANDTNTISASESISLSPNGKGDALIYPSFKANGGWETKITVRNAKPVSVVAKAVLYDAYDSHELKDFNLYLSGHDVASFKIREQDNKVIVTTRDGSIMAGLEEGLRNDMAIPVKHEDPANTDNGNIGTDRIDNKNDFIISDIPNFSNESNNSGYVIVYVMAQTEGNTSVGAKEIDYYHNNHVGLYSAYYHALTECRGENWIKIFRHYGAAKNGTATKYDVLAPNVKPNCDKSYFTSPESDILFGEVSMSRSGSDPRSLLLKAKAIENYTVEKYKADGTLDEDNSQMMLWAPGEYASIQDRNIKAVKYSKYAKYDTEGIAKDAANMVVRHAYFSFNKHTTKNDRSVLIITQPMKRALVMADKGDIYWDRITKYSNWGEFALPNMNFYDENENADVKGYKFITITSPANSEDAKLYQPEMAPLDYNTLAKGANQTIFKENQTNGYADIQINGDKGLPAIVTEMVSEDINGEAQINWIYSTTYKE